jgi:hypothetical protein
MLRATTLEFAAVSSVCAVLLISWIVERRAASSRVEPWALGCFGASVPLLPSLGSHGLLLCTVAFCIFRLPRSLPKAQWAVPFLALLTATAVGEAILPIVTVQWWGGAIQGVRSLLSFGYLLDAQIPTLDLLLRMAVLVSLVQLFQYSEARERKCFVTGLTMGAIVASLVTLTQVFNLLPIELPNQTAFWNLVHRFTGTFTDPNAQGVFLALLPFVVFSCVTNANRAECRRPIALLVVAALLMLGLSAGLVSGSRSFVMVVLFSIAVLFVRHSWRVAVVFTTVAIAGVAAITILDAYTPLVANALNAPLVPEGLRRAVGTISLSRVSESFFSRQVFSIMALHLFVLNPVLGIGADRFSSFVPSIESIVGVDLKGWVDNSNNFYLGVLAEFGILGVVACCLSIRSRSFKDGEPVAKLGLAALALALLTGPHLDFSEVLVLAAFLISQATVPASEPKADEQRFAQVTTLFVCSLGLLGGLFREHGTYAWEREGSQYHQWLSPVAVVTTSCGCEESSKLQIESPSGSVERPVTTILRGIDGWKRTVTFTRPGVHEITLPCSSGPETAPEYTPARLRLLVATDAAAAVDDPRMLAVRLRMRKPADRFGQRVCRRWG